MLGFIFFGVLWAACSGQYFHDPSLSNKPILRMGPENPEEPPFVPVSTTEEPKEPTWVTNLRSNIKNAILFKGFDQAQSSIKEMIADADIAVNGDHISRSKDDVAALRTYTDAITNYNNDDESAALRSSGPLWEKDLKNYIKGLIGQYGKSHLDDYVRPVVGAIESSNNIVIKDIDGEVSVNWKAAKPQENDY